MSLTELWKSNPEQIRAYTMRQLVVMAGDGNLLDRSVCSQELRAYLAQADADRLGALANECLKEPFDDSGLVLQDIVNEIGRRLEFVVQAGVYRGRKGTNGVDGIWRAGDLHFVIEVKTTDAYRIDLEQVAKYRGLLIDEGEIGSESSILFVVGRQDTRGLEEQIRGSRHAWTIRVIGVESLVDLLKVKVKSESDDVVGRIQALLKPVEYTRIDGIVALMFKATAETAAEPTGETVDSPSDAKARAAKRAPSSPAAPGIEDLREHAAQALGKQTGVGLTRRRRSLYASSDGAVHAVIAVSKRYPRDYQPYWYGLYDTQVEFLADATNGHLVLGALDTGRAWAIPFGVVQALLPKLHKTVREEGQTYSHIGLKLIGADCRLVGKDVEMPLAEFELDV